MSHVTTPQAGRKATLLERLASLGWKPGLPSEDFSLEAVGADAATAAEMSCACGHRGLAALPIHAGRTYGVVVICPACNFMEEV